MKIRLIKETRFDGSVMFSIEQLSEAGNWLYISDSLATTEEEARTKWENYKRLKTFVILPEVIEEFES